MRGPKVEYACYLSFHADFLHEGTSQLSYYYNNTAINRQDQTIDFAKRNLLPSRQLQICRINFCAATESNGDQFREKNNKLNYLAHLKLTNKRLMEFFKKVRPYSVIYITAHSSRNHPNKLIQIIDMPHGRSISNFIDIKDLADWMSRYIPQYAQSNLKIHLLVCNSIDIAAALMGALNSQGFKKTSVVGYIGAQSTMYTDANTITDFSTAERTYNKTHYGRINSDGQHYMVDFYPIILWSTLCQSYKFQIDYK